MKSFWSYIIVNRINPLLMFPLMIITLGTTKVYPRAEKVYTNSGKRVGQKFIETRVAGLNNKFKKNDIKQSSGNLEENNIGEVNSYSFSNKSFENDKEKLALSKEELQNLQKNKREVNRVKNDSSKMQKPLDAKSLGIGDLIIDHTQSKWGRDFVDLFNKYWNPPSHIGDYTIIIEERPMPRFGTVILIKVNGNYIYQKFIQPRYETIKMNAVNGTRLTLSYLENYRRIQNELQGEDMKGTGIY